MNRMFNISIIVNNLHSIFIMNGLYIPILYVGLYIITHDIFLSTTISLKMYTTNYFYWFGSQYKYLPEEYGWVKQFTRFTDTGFFASMIYYVYPEFFPIAYNVHFVITFGYWIGKLLFSMNESEEIHDSVIIKSVEQIVSALNHSLHLVMLSYIASNYSVLHECHHSLFTLQDVKYTFYWAYGWFIYIYIPWRMCTNDCVYTVLHINSPIQQQLGFIGVIHILILIGNMTGYVLQTCS